MIKEYKYIRYLWNQDFSYFYHILKLGGEEGGQGTWSGNPQWVFEWKVRTMSVCFLFLSIYEAWVLILRRSPPPALNPNDWSTAGYNDQPTPTQSPTSRCNGVVFVGMIYMRMCRRFCPWALTASTSLFALIFDKRLRASWKRLSSIAACFQS